MLATRGGEAMFTNNFMTVTACCLFTVLFLTFFTTQSVHSEQHEEVEYESEIRVAPEQCLQLMSSHKGGGNTWQLRFQNVCGQRVYAHACVEERPGKFRLHKSGARIPKFGYWNIFTHEGHAPLSVQIASAPGVPRIPGNCATYR